MVVRLHSAAQGDDVRGLTKICMVPHALARRRLVLSVSFCLPRSKQRLSLSTTVAMSQAVDEALEIFITKVQSASANGDSDDLQKVFQQLTEECAPAFNAAMINSFDDFDKDGSGKLDKAEFKGVIVKFLDNLTKVANILIDAQIQSLRKQAKGTGAENFPLDFVLANYNQAKEMMASKQFVEAALQNSGEMMEKLDADKDGLISVEEFKVLCETHLSLHELVDQSQSMLH